MSFENIKQLAKGTSTININGVKEEVKLLTVSEREQYDNIANEGFGTIQANLGRNNQTQKANMNIQKVTEAQNKANRYLVKTTYKDDNLTDEDIDTLYDVYNILVKELKRVNGIVETDDLEAVEAMQNKTAEDLKK